MHVNAIFIRLIVACLIALGVTLHKIIELLWPKR